MRKLATFVTAASMALALGACKKEEKTGDEGDTAGATTTEPETPKEPEEKKWTSADSIETFKACTQAFNSHDAAKMQECYADDVQLKILDFVGPAKLEAEGAEAVVGMLKMYMSGFPDLQHEPQLIVADENKVAAIVLETGTNTGEMMGQPPTNQNMSHYTAELVWFDDEGKMKKMVTLGDQATAAHQLGMHKSDKAADAEKPWPEKVEVGTDEAQAEKVSTNVELVKNSLSAVEKKDADSVLAHVADDVEFRYVPHAEGMSGKEAYSKGMNQYLDMSAGMKRDVQEVFGAGDWVAAWSQVENELATDIPGAKGSKGKKTRLHQIEFFHVTDGKIDKHWVFENSFQFAVQVGLIEPMGGAGGGDAPAKAGAGKNAPPKGKKKKAATKAKKSDDEGGW